MIRIDIATLFTDMCDAVMGESIIGRAGRENKFEYYSHNIRDYTTSKQARVDDYPYGGGPGMVMQADPIARCLDAVLGQYEEQGRSRPKICFMMPGGRSFTQEVAKEYAQLDGIILVCGHYEGIDQRVLDEYADEEISIGDFVLTGGELAALCVADSVLRLQKGVLKSQQGYVEESFYNGLLEYPQYSRPDVWRGREVPAVLLTGHAAHVDGWRREQSLLRTKQRRPDLYEKIPVCELDPMKKRSSGKG